MIEIPDGLVQWIFSQSVSNGLKQILCLFGRHPAKAQVSCMSWTTRRRMPRMESTWVMLVCQKVKYAVRYWAGTVRICNDNSLWRRAEDQRTLTDHNPEHHGDFLLEVFLLAKPQSAALEATEEQQQEKLIQQSQPVWREANNEKRTELAQCGNSPKLWT